jgi:hypothetical protein
MNFVQREVNDDLMSVVVVVVIVVVPARVAAALPPCGDRVAAATYSWPRRRRRRTGPAPRSRRTHQRAQQPHGPAVICCCGRTICESAPRRGHVEQLPAIAASLHDDAKKWSSRAVVGKAATEQHGTTAELRTTIAHTPSVAMPPFVSPSHAYLVGQSRVDDGTVKKPRLGHQNSMRYVT